jgi:hypothetical protein
MKVGGHVISDEEGEALDMLTSALAAEREHEARMERDAADALLPFLQHEADEEALEGWE